MPVVEWDSYIMQRRDLIQHLIGHIDIDADLATRQPAELSRHAGNKFLGTARPALGGRHSGHSGRPGTSVNYQDSSGPWLRKQE